MRQILVLDDDPTGTQCASGVDVLLRPSGAELESFLAADRPTAYVLTNTRSMPATDAVELIRSVRAAAERRSAVTSRAVRYVLRGDSTLRGHVFAEVDAVAVAGSVTLFVPAFPAGGRVTRGGVQYLDGLPVVDTEYARDPVFAFASRRLVEWVAEVGDGRPAVEVDLVLLRSTAGGGLADVLCAAAPGSVVIPDAETDADLAFVAAGLATAENRGRAVTVRAASPFAALVAGTGPRPLASVAVAGPVLVVCGSHTDGAARQLARLARVVGPPVVLATDAALAGADLTPVTARIRERLAAVGWAVLASERARRAEHGRLEHGSIIMAALVAVARSVAAQCGAVIAKGGITSADVATRALGAAEAHVLGQVLPGVPVWSLPDGRPYAVVPGNVGDDDTLWRVARAFGLPDSVG